jgi:hypothetical protein
MNQKVTNVIKQTELFADKGKNDTIRLWESHKEQALLWRSIALIQVPATCIALVFALILWTTRSITLNVPSKPLPGMYMAQDIPDSEFIDVATDFLNLYATYRSSVARKQFAAAREMLNEPMLSKFDKEVVTVELKAIEGTNRTQVFFPDPTETKLVRKGREITVSLMGERSKIIAGKELEPVVTRFTLTMTSIPRNKLNPYGIVITNVMSEQIER